jgi:hypothetical protein
MKLYSRESSYPKTNAQINLSGRTHYVEDQSLKYHHARILSSGHTYDGLLFYIIESCAADHLNKNRVIRGVVFDVFGKVVYRPSLEDSFKTSDKARKAMWAAITLIDPIEVTRDAISRKETENAREIDEARALVNSIDLKLQGVAA